MGHAYQHEDEMETEHMEQIKILCAERDELVAALRAIVTWLEYAPKPECALNAARAALAKVTP